MTSSKRAIPFRIPTETSRQLLALMAYEGQDNKSALLVAAIEERYTRQHGRIHFDLAQNEAGVCPWCGWAPPPDDDDAAEEIPFEQKIATDRAIQKLWKK